MRAYFCFAAALAFFLMALGFILGQTWVVIGGPIIVATVVIGELMYQEKKKK